MVTMLKSPFHIYDCGYAVALVACMCVLIATPDIRSNHFMCGL